MEPLFRKVQCTDSLWANLLGRIMENRVGFFLPLLCMALLLAAPAQGQGVDPDPCEQGPELYKANRFMEARTAFLACLESQGEAMEVLLPLTVMAVKDGRMEEAEKFGLQAVALGPEDPEAHYWLGRTYLVSGRPKEARLQWEKGLSFSIDHMGILEGLARLSLAEGETEKAYGLLTQLQRQGVDDGWLHRLLADIAAAKGLWAQTLVHLESAMARDGANATDLLAAAELSILDGQNQNAVDFCRRAVALEPSGASYGGLGEAFFAIEQSDSAQFYLRLAVEQAPTEPRHQFNLANILEVAGNFDEADTYFRSFLKMVPNDSVGHFNFGVHLDKLGQTQEGKEHIQKALNLDPSMLSAWVVMARLLEKEGDLAGALDIVGQLENLGAWESNDISLWAQKLREQVSVAGDATAEGKVHLLHLVVATQDVLDLVMQEIDKGENFYSLVARFSTGPAAARGGDIGWVNPEEMAPEFHAKIADLGINKISPPIESGGLYHLFKRIP